MAAPDWFRRTSWSDADREDFEKRLARARPSSRAQYLRIQAVHLAETRDEQLTRVALELLARMLAEYPDDLQVAWAHEQRAECLLRLGDWSGAVDAYRAAMRAERARPNVHTASYLRFGYLVVTRGARELFEEAARVAEEGIGRSRPMPVERFHWHVIHALLAEAHDDRARARDHARAALEAAGARHSGFRYHAGMGLVGEVEPVLEQRLRALAGLEAQ